MPGSKLNATTDGGPQSNPGSAPVAVDLPDSKHKGDASKKEIGGRDGPDPTRFGDWEKNGRCIDF